MRLRYREFCDRVSYRGKYIFRQKTALSHALVANDGDSSLLKDIIVAKATVCAGQSSVFTMSKRVWLPEQMEAGVWLLLFCPGGG